MRLIEFTDEQIAWLRGVMQNPLSDEPTLADERLRGEIFEATADDTAYLTTEGVGVAVRSIKAAQDRVDAAQRQAEYGCIQWHRLEMVDDRLNHALTALGD